MPRRARDFSLMLGPRSAGESAVQWLYQALRGAILEGRLRPGARVPATRDLARNYGLARGTVVTAYEHLRAEGYLDGRTGSGTYVSPVLPDELLSVARGGGREQTPRARAVRSFSSYGRRAVGLPENRPPSPRAFRTDRPALDLFPVTLWAQLTSRRLRRITPSQLLGSGAAGYQPLREAVADYLVTSRGVQCEASQVLIVSGMQEALDLVARVFLDPGQRVAMENPGYIGARLVFEAVGASLIPMAVDEEGMCVSEAALHGARLVYLTPAHQFPTGVSLSLARRLALLDWARRSGALIVEDDYDSEYRYAGRPVPALQGLDRDGLVLFAGSFSKVLFPSLRLGYLVLPSDLFDRFAAVQSNTARYGPLLQQLVLTDFMVGGHFARHIRRMREIYAERLGVLLEEIRTHLAGPLEIRGIEAGLQTTAWLAPGLRAEAVADAAFTRGVDVTPLSRYCLRPVKAEGLHLGFAAVDPPEIRRGVRDLAAAIAGL